MHDEGIHQKIAEFAKQTMIAEQIAFLDSLNSNPIEIVGFSVYEKPKTKQQMIKKLKKNNINQEIGLENLKTKKDIENGKL